MPENTDRRSTIGLKRLVMWPLTADTESELDYGNPTEFVKSLMTATRTPNQVEADQSADNQVVEDVTLNMGGTLAFGLTAINATDRTLLYGNEEDAGSIRIHKDDLPPYLAVAYMATRRDGTVNLYKFMKSSYAEQAETHETVQSGSVKFATTNIQGKYIATTNGGDYGYIRMGVDTVADAAVVDSWFTDADYHGPAAGEG